MWAQNLLGKKTIAGTLGAAPTALKEFEYVSSCAFALLWNMTKSRVPEEILIDIKNLMSSDNTSFKMDQGLKYWGVTFDTSLRSALLYGAPFSRSHFEVAALVNLFVLLLPVFPFPVLIIDHLVSLAYKHSR
jgi:hypothetical protein